jgi:adenylate cyclase
VSAPELLDLVLCFEGAVPAVIATASADGTPNITYLSRVRLVDAERIALSNQFFSKTARNLAENPRASLIVVDPGTHDQYRLSLVYERTERRGPVFDQLRTDLEAIAALQGMEGVFKLRAADIYRVVDIEQLGSPQGLPPGMHAAPAAQLAELTGRLGRCADLDTLLSATVDGLADLFGYEHSLLLLLDERDRHLYTIAAHGYEAEGVGSEVAVGEGMIGMTAARAAPMRVGNLRQMSKYSRIVRETYEEHEGVGPGRDIPVPGLADAQSRVTVPAMAMGQVVGVLVVESSEAVAFTADDEALLGVVAAVVGNAVEIERARERLADAPEVPQPASQPLAAGDPGGGGAATHVRFFPVDGSTFLDGDYLIKGVAGRLLWALLGQHQREGRTDFTNREMRLDPSLELPEFRDNFESRLVLLKRRLDEREAPIRIDKTGRGRFRLAVDGPVRLDPA